MAAVRLDSETLLPPGYPAVASFGDSTDGASDVESAQSPALDARASVALVEDADGYERSVHGINIRSTRTGPGAGPNVVFAANAGDIPVTSVDVGFPMINRTTMADDRIVVGSIRSAPAGARWSGIDLQPGAVIVYGPGAEHVGDNPAGLGFAFAVVKTEAIEELADRLGLRFRPPPPGSVNALESVTGATAFGDTMSSFVQAATSGTTVQANQYDEILYRATVALSRDRLSRSGESRRIDSRRLVYTCLDHAEAIGRVPSIGELCLATHVSERLLRRAFGEVCGMPPTAFFRVWGLNEAHRRLRESNRTRVTVSRVAFELGFCHLGRFSGRYAQLFGETPSKTLGRHA